MANENALNIMHWPGQDSYVCDEHLRQARVVADVCGFGPISATRCEPNECKNCTNETRKETDNGQ